MGKICQENIQFGNVCQTSARSSADQDIKDAVANGAESYREIRDLLDLGTCCGRCAPEARAIISDELAEIAARISVAA